MPELICEPCKEAGHTNIIAHYKEVPAGQSTTGRREPPMCFDHKHGKTPRHIAKQWAQELKPPPVAKKDPPPQAEEAQEEPEPVESTDEAEVEQPVEAQPDVTAIPAEKDEPSLPAEPQKPTKWGAIVAVCAGLEAGKSALFTTIHDPKKYANQLRAMLSGTTLTMNIKFTVETLDGAVKVTSRGERNDLLHEIQETKDLLKREPKDLVDEDNDLPLVRKLATDPPDVKNTFEMTPGIAVAIWKSLSLSQKAALMDVDDVFLNGFDDAMQMETIGTCLIRLPVAQPAQREGD